LPAPDDLPPAAIAFDAIAGDFDDRYGAWLSVAAQRRAVRRELLRAFPAGSRLLEIGGGTGIDALFLAERGRDVLLTDAAPTMVRIAAERLGARVANRPRHLAAERLGDLAAEREDRGTPAFDGVFSNFAALNCVSDLEPVARALARLTRPGARALLVLFGTTSAGEVVVQLARRDVSAAFRRRSRSDVRARLAGREFTVRYTRARELAHSMSPWFRVVSRRGIGVFVPPSAAEPWISTHPRLLGALESLDRVASRTLSMFGDHVLHEFQRTTVPVSAS
jgi:SAM-dependent methyltransferase